MTGEEILNEVRFLTGIDNWGRYTEINRAFRKVCQFTNFNWLRASIENIMPIKSGVTEYDLTLPDMRRLERLWVYGVQSSQLYWHLMEEVPPLLFEEKVRTYKLPDGNNQETRPAFYKLEGTILTLTPTPDQNYSTKFDYIRFIPEVQRDTEPIVPKAYHDTIAQLAAAYVMEQQGTEVGMIRSKDLQQRAMNELQGLVLDSHPNRTYDIDRKPLAWIK